jgi:drug/metabolite transporter superfamily protein YnfA
MISYFETFEEAGNSRMKNIVPLFLFLLAAILESGGDAIIRKGLQGAGIATIAAGILVLGCYGLLVNSVKWDFSKMMGVYIALFAAVSILIGKMIFKETIPVSTWIGLSIILLGGVIIQFG